ncbi:TAXI family TRAP transporter solute-binding subunit [Bhargavaea beijingensis]|uniref:TAXI family TRAP transporter solute-binding subunit n=1 Tax=Bhargavaea beijingensis TaxID=426756 RepID=UPI002224B1FC|nr:TAXI family TRAP transporter solute-binding subunit [Bhargavaea beijingensis]MCW1929203.1 TAXI family TRAP transporter solute-binding subunit [Bhargavaea beijingensis]
MKKKFWRLAVLSVIMLVLSACGGEEGSGGGESGANIAIGPPASATNGLSKIIFEAYGLEDGDYKEFQEGFGDAADGVQDGNIDVSIGILGLPAGSIENLQSATGDVKLISLSDEAVAHIEKNTQYKAMTIPAGTYDFQKEEIQTVTAYAILMANTDTIDEETGYQLTKTMIEKASENTHAQAKEMTLENALKGSEGLPIHPGAKRYYEEQGLTVENPVAEVKADGSKKELVLGTGSQGGTYYPLGGEMATIWNRSVDGINITNTETGASIENMATIRDGNMDLGMTVHETALFAVNGEQDFEDNSVPNAAFIGHIYPEVVQIVTREASGISGFEDLN